MHFDEPAPAPIPDLQRLPDTTQRMLDTVRQLIRDRTVIPARVFTSRLEALIDELVSSLVPLMAAEERVLCHRLDRALGDPMREDHREMGRLIERLSMLSEGLERRSRRATKIEQVLLTAMQQMAIALDALRTHQQAALRHLSGTLPLDEQARLAATLEAAALDAREQTMLIVRPPIPPTAAHVLRNRPDLNAAYAMTLAEIERRVQEAKLPKEKRTMSQDHPLDELAGSRPAGRISIPVVTTNIDSELAALRRSASYRRNDHASTTIVNRPGLGVVLVALPKGGHMAEHRAARPIVLRVLEGRVRLALADRTLEMSPGDLTSLAPNLAHEVSGVEDSAFLLTIGGGARQVPSQ